MKLRQLFSDLSLFFLLFSTIFCNNIFYDSYQAPKAFAYLLIIIFIFIFLLFFNFKIKIDFIFITSFCLFYYFFIQILFSDNSPSFYYIFIFLSPAAFFIPFFLKINSYKNILFLNIILLLSLIYGICQFIIFDIKRPYSFFGNPIFFAEFISILFPFAFFGLTHEKFMTISIINIPFAIINLFLCQSRGALISFFIILFLLFLIIIKTGKQKTFNKKIIFYILIIFIFLVIFIPGFWVNIKSFSDKVKSSFSSENHDLSGRALLVKSSLEIFMDNPFFGSGPGAIKKMLQLKEAEFLKKNKSLSFINSSYSHNDYIQIISETGIIGILLFLLLVFTVFHKVEKNIINFNNKKYIFILCLSFSVFFILFEAFFNFPLFIFPTTMFFYFFIGLLYTTVGGICFEKIVNISLKSKFMILLILFPLFFIFFKNINKITSNIYLSNAIKQSYFDFENSEIFFKKSVFLDPENLYNLTNFATFYFNNGKYEESMQIFKSALKIFPYSADIYYNIGLIHELKKEYYLAEKYYKMALYLYPDFAHANLGLYKIYLQLKPEEDDKYLMFLYKAIMRDADITRKTGINLFYLKEVTIENFNK